LWAFWQGGKMNILHVIPDKWIGLFYRRQILAHRRGDIPQEAFWQHCIATGLAPRWTLETLTNSGSSRFGNGKSLRYTYTLAPESTAGYPRL
jgi:hypothetical protein